MRKRRYVKLGDQFGRLTVVRRLEDWVRNNGQKRSMWLCSCACGGEKSIKGERLTNGHTQSCGCLQKEKAREISKLGQQARRYKTEEERGLNWLYKRLRSTKRARELGCTITFEQFKQLYWQNCFYCGAYPETKINTHRKIQQGASGLDRLDSNKGYHMDNVKPCCSRCNKMKNNMSHPDFISHIFQIFHHSINSDVETPWK